MGFQMGHESADLAAALFALVPQLHCLCSKQMSSVMGDVNL
jgi:hypothetical protein